jgi:hypothetical protein
LLASAAFASPDHDHGDKAPAAASNAPKRLPDGSVFLPKPSQRQLAVRTVVAEMKAVPQTVELSGRVLMDSNAGGRVQPTQAGRVEAGAGGLPQLGQAVRKGQVLAVVRLLVAPITGFISAANVVAGQVVDAREVLFEIVDPARLVVEALAFDVALVGNVASASATPGAGLSVPLRFAGAGRAQREGAIPLLFRTAGAPTVPLAVNQAVKVVVQSRSTVQGIPVPAGAVVRNPSNQDIVWVHNDAETFTPKTVRVVPLDGANVSVVDGLKAGDRVVTQGASLVNQVR